MWPIIDIIWTTRQLNNVQRHLKEQSIVAVQYNNENETSRESAYLKQQVLEYIMRFCDDILCKEALHLVGKTSDIVQ